VLLVISARETKRPRVVVVEVRADAANLSPLVLPAIISRGHLDHGINHISTHDE
jgi:hypothetical protein